MNRDSIHLRILQARKEAGLTQNELAEALGVGRSTYISFERGTIDIYRPVAIKAADFYKRTPEEFYFGFSLDDQILQDQASLGEWKRAIIDDYEQRLTELRKELEVANETLKKQEGTIRQNEETIHYLLKQLRKND